MEIIFTNNAKDRSVYRYKKDFERILERACKVLDRKGDWSLSVIYVTPEQIYEINRDYRNVDRPTDVISFAIQDDMSDMLIKQVPMDIRFVEKLVSYSVMDYFT